MNIKHQHMIRGWDFSYNLQSLHGEVPPSLLPKYLGGDQDKEMYKCVEKAKQLDSHFLKNIENARYVHVHEQSKWKLAVSFCAIYCVMFRQIYAQSAGED